MYELFLYIYSYIYIFSKVNCLDFTSSSDFQKHVECKCFKGNGYWRSVQPQGDNPRAPPTAYLNKLKQVKSVVRLFNSGIIYILHFNNQLAFSLPLSYSQNTL